MSNPDYSNIRQIIGDLIGHRLVDITQHDKDEFEETRESYIMLHFDNGGYVKVPIGDSGFHHNCVGM
jgi:hypothetical protein